MKIELTTLRRIAKAVPELTIAQFVAIWSEKHEDERREIERVRIANKRAAEANNLPTSANISQREQDEKDYFALGKSILGLRSGGMLASLLKAKDQNIVEAREVLDLARNKFDPREYVAAACRRLPHGQQPGYVGAAADRLIAAAEATEGGGGTIDPEYIDHDSD